MDKIQGSHGTRVVLFNLRKREGESNGEGEREHEFDFSVGNDIRMLGDTEDKNNRGLSSKNTSRRPVFQQHRDGQQATLDVPEDYSLRAYMEVLYLRPRCAFYLRGEKIQPRCPISRLTKEYYVFPEYKTERFSVRYNRPLRVHRGKLEIVRLPHLQQKSFDSIVPTLCESVASELHDEGHAWRHRGGLFGADAQ